MTEPDNTTDVGTTPVPDSAGPKTTEALNALDAAIAKVQAFHEDDDEQDASLIWERVNTLTERLQGVPSHMPKDALTGFPVDPSSGNALGPADPVVTPEEAGQAPSQPEGTPNLSDNPSAAPADGTQPATSESAAPADGTAQTGTSPA